MNFFQIETLGDPNDEDLCMLRSGIEGLGAEDWRLFRGERIGPLYPAEARIFMSREERGMKVCDVLGNTDSMLIVSSALKAVIEKHCQGVDIEYLSFTLYDHRRRVHSRDYFIINPIGSLDCLDEIASRVKHGSQGAIVHVGEYVLDRAKVKEVPQLFRVAQWPSRYIIGLKLAQEIYDRNFTNVLWTELRFSDEPAPGS